MISEILINSLSERDSASIMAITLIIWRPGGRITYNAKKGSA